MLLREKADQAQALLEETGLDCWMTFARETGDRPDPGVELVVGSNVTWNSAFLFGRGGQRVAIVGRYDAPTVEASGVFREVRGYDAGIQADLLDVLGRLDPRTIGLNYSADDTTADGLSYGMWLLLHDLLRGTPYPQRFTSAAPLLAKLRARKTPAEVERIRAAVAATEEIVALFGAAVRPGVSEAELGALVHAQLRARGLASAREWESCPFVNSGPESSVGHTRPSEQVRVAPGHLVHIDLGVRHEGFCSDVQRMWYVRRPGEQAPPESVRRAFDTVLRAIDAGAAALRPGVQGHTVDAAARRVVVEAGYEEYKHALGHGLGRACHDGGALLGPRWERYGATPDGIVEAGNVFTLELGVATEAGYIGLEEDVLVTEQGCVFLTTPQRELWLV